MTKRVAGVCALLLAALFVFVGYRAVRNVAGWALPSANAPVARPAPNATQVTVVVAKGENARSIGDKLQKAGVVRSGTWFRMLAEIEGIQNDLAAGSYVFQTDSDTQAVLDRIKVGILEPQVLVTIPEGLRIEQVADLIHRAGLFDSTDTLLNAMKTASPQGAVLQDRPEGSTLEGYVFPDTYYFPLKTTPDGVLTEMLNALNDRFDPDLRTAAQASGMSDYQVLTLASIVEREAQVPEERPIIASVYLNRLKQGMPLQADPTVQYAIAQDPASVAANGWWKRDLLEADLKVDSPYNTYTHTGLPPGPICNPGRAAIDAVVHPAQTSYLYFVAKGDGSHAFATTLAEHNANVAKYQHR